MKFWKWDNFCTENRKIIKFWKGDNFYTENGKIMRQFLSRKQGNYEVLYTEGVGGGLQLYRF